MGDNKYKNGRIYKIVDNGYNKMYIGSTVQSLSNRMSEHRKRFNKYRNGQDTNYTSSFVIFEEYGMDNCKIELIEVFPCGSKEELHKQEGFHIKSNDCVNKLVNGRTRHDWYKDNKDAIQDKQRQYAMNHKEQIKEYKKKYFEEHKDELTRKSKERYQANRETVLAQCKDYREKHKDKKRDADKRYQEANKDKIAEKRNANVRCATCGYSYTHCNKARHERSKTHQRKLQDLSNKKGNEIIEIMEI